MVKKGHCEGTAGKLVVKLSLLKRDETSWDVAALLTMLAGETDYNEKKKYSGDPFFRSCEASCLEYHPLWGDCNTGQRNSFYR